MAEHPSFPSGEPLRPLVDAFFGCSSETLFASVWHPGSAFQVAFHRERGNTEVVESAWVDSLQELPQPQFTWSEAPPPAPVLPTPGKWRKVRFLSPPQGMATRPFNTEEVQHVCDVAAGSTYTVEAAIYTNNTYADKFNPMVRYSITAVDSGSCRLVVGFAIAYGKSASRLLRPIIQAGVDSGIKINFAAFEKVLASHHPPLPAGGAAAPAAAALPAAAPAAAAQPAAAATQATMADLNRALPLLGLFSWADHLVYGDLVSRLAALSGSLDAAVLSKAIAVALTLGVLRVVLAALDGARAVCGSRAGALLQPVCWPLLNLVAWPDSMGQVLATLLLVAAVNRALLVGSEVVAAYARQLAATPGAAASAATEPAAYSVPPAASAAAANIVASASAVPAAAAPAPPSAAAAQPAATISAVDAVANAASAAAAAADSWLDAVGNSVANGVMSLGSQFARQFAPRPPTPANGLEMSGLGLQGGAGASAAAGGALRSVGSGPGGFGAPEDAASSADAAAATTDAAAAARQGGVPTSPRQSEAAPRSAPPARPFPAELLARMSEVGGSNSNGSSNASGGGSEVAAPAERSRVEIPEAIVEEVYESERYQPIKGWGHTWPGHFLPSDRIGRWSDRYGRPTTKGVEFDAVARPLPPGWVWLEEKWRVDMTGADVKAVDDDGWCYAMDFPWLDIPFAAGSGVMRKRSFVRKRRWMRTRVKAGSAAAQGAQPPHPTAETPEKAEQAAAAAAAGVSRKPSMVGVEAAFLSDGMSDSCIFVPVLSPTSSALHRAASSPARSASVASDGAGSPAKALADAAAAALGSPPPSPLPVTQPPGVVVMGQEEPAARSNGNNISGGGSAEDAAALPSVLGRVTSGEAGEAASGLARVASAEAGGRPRPAPVAVPPTDAALLAGSGASGSGEGLFLDPLGVTSPKARNLFDAAGRSAGAGSSGDAPLVTRTAAPQPPVRPAPVAPAAPLALAAASAVASRYAKAAPAAAAAPMRIHSQQEMSVLGGAAGGPGDKPPAAASEPTSAPASAPASWPAFVAGLQSAAVSLHSAAARVGSPPAAGGLSSGGAAAGGDRTAASSQQAAAPNPPAKLSAGEEMMQAFQRGWNSLSNLDIGGAKDAGKGAAPAKPPRPPQPQQQPQQQPAPPATAPAAQVATAPSPPAAQPAVYSDEEYDDDSSSGGGTPEQDRRRPMLGGRMKKGYMRLPQESMSPQQSEGSPLMGRRSAGGSGAQPSGLSRANS